MVKNKAEVVMLLPFSFYPLIMTIVAKSMNNLTFRRCICLVKPLIIVAFYIIIYALKGICSAVIAKFFPFVLGHVVNIVMLPPPNIVLELVYGYQLILVPN